MNHPILQCEFDGSIQEQISILNAPTVGLSDEEWQIIADSIYGHDRDRYIRKLFNKIIDPVIKSNLEKEELTYDDISTGGYNGLQEDLVVKAFKDFNEKTGIRFFDT